MPKNIRDIMNEVAELNIGIQQILYHAQYEYYEDLSGLEYDKTSAEDLFVLDKLQQVLSKFDDIAHTLKYLNRPVKTEGVLHKNENGRYEVNGIELTSGCGIEYLAEDDRHCTYDENDNYVSVPYWKSSRIEHNGKDYYIVGAKKISTLEKVRVRMR